MAGIISLIGAISADLVAKMGAAGLAPLVDGRIVVGQVAANENSFAPRVVFIPQSFRWAAMSPGTNSQPIDPNNPNAPGFGVRSIMMTQYGGGYDGATAVVLSAPDVAGGVQATATPTIVNSSVSRIVVTNPGSGYLRPPSVTINGIGAAASATANLRPTPQAVTVATARSIFTEWHKFEVHCWGVSSSGGVAAPDVLLDYDATQQLFQQIIASAQALAAGVHLESAGKWVDASTGANLVDVVGHYATFTIELATPLLAEPMPPATGASVQHAPAQTQINPTNLLIPFSGGTPEQG